MTNLDRSSSEGEWRKEEFYFGQMNFESWRRRGEEAQILEHLGMQLIAPEAGNQYSVPVSPDVLDFISKHVECEFVVADSYPLKGSIERQPPQLWLQGWIAGTLEEFESGKKHSM